MDMCIIYTCAFLFGSLLVEVRFDRESEMKKVEK